MNEMNEMKRTIKELKEMVTTLSFKVSQLNAASICCCPSMMNCKIHRKKYDPMACHRSMADNAVHSKPKVQLIGSSEYEGIVFADEPKKDFTKRDRRVNAHRKNIVPEKSIEPEPEIEPIAQMVEEYKSNEPVQGKKFKKPTKRSRSIYTARNTYRPVSPSMSCISDDASNETTALTLLQDNSIDEPVQDPVPVQDPEPAFQEPVQEPVPVQEPAQDILNVLNHPIIKDMTTTSVSSNDSLIHTIRENPDIADMTERVFNDTHYAATKRMFSELSLIKTKKALNKFRIKHGVSPLLTSTLEEQLEEMKFALRIHMGTVDEQRLKLFSLKALKDFANDTDLNVSNSITKQKLIQLILKEYQ